MAEPVIRFSNLSHGFGTGRLRRQVLFDLCGEVHAGEIVIITGPSGSGKTTLLTLLGGLRSVQQGELTVLGRRMDRADERARRAVRRGIGYVFQAHNLIKSLTATQNLLMVLRLHKEIANPISAARDMLGELGLSDFVDTRPGQLSGGQRQRVAIARALVARPKIVLADEPTASIDGETGHAIIEQLRRLAKERETAIVLVTHDHRVLDAGDRVIAIRDGRFCVEDDRLHPHRKEYSGDRFAE
jgi:putative ABC transport system ATP-binding protein